jgi:glycosyltransferase involved in cell wall biosynthesis
MSCHQTPEISLVIPCYNEAAVLPLLEERLKAFLAKLGSGWEVIFVDDGSKDSTFSLLCAMHHAEPRFKVISLSRNFGHQAAILAGMSQATGQVVGIADADLQDPPELFATCLEKLKEGYDVAYAVRKRRKEGYFKRTAYALFYRFLHWVAEVEIPLDSGDFCLMDRRVVNVLNAMPERNVFVRGLRAWSGFRQVGVAYEREARAAGQTKYPLSRLLRLATDGIFAFSTMPLRLATLLGFAGLSIALVAGAFAVVWRIAGFRFMGHTAAELPGWTAVVCLVLFLGGMQFLMLGCLGEYIGRIYGEVKQRPRWIVREELGLGSHDAAAARRDL